MNWLKHFPELKSIENKSLHAELAQQKVIHAPKGHQLFREGDACRGYVLVISGSIRVYKMDEEGREILLYRVSAGQSCMLTTTCLLGLQNYPAAGVAETDVELVVLSGKLFERLLMGSDHFRRYAMAYIGERICEMMLLIEDVAFGRMDQRVARLLLARAEKSGDALICTHQELASELGTAREVVSRILKSFESREWIVLSRGMIELRERSMLGQITHS
ncbi:MAG: Crp/Fnr family transcriptional regulator [Mariprofundaceae bacterium]